MSSLCIGSLHMREIRMVRMLIDNANYIDLRCPDSPVSILFELKVVHAIP